MTYTKEYYEVASKLKQANAAVSQYYNESEALKEKGDAGWKVYYDIAVANIQLSDLYEAQLAHLDPTRA